MQSEDTSGIHLWLVLWKAFRAMQAYDLRSIEALSLGLSDFAVLEVLLHKGPLPVNTIGRKVLLTTGSITTAIDRLESRKWVKRRTDSQDRRVVHVELTTAGRQWITREFQRHAQRMEIPAEVLSPKERSALLKLLRKIGHEAERLHAGP